MKALRFNISIIICIFVSLVAGCNDTTVTPVSTDPESFYSSGTLTDFEEGNFNAKLTLDAGETKVFAYDNTNLILINSYSISNCSDVTGDLFISSSMQADTISLPCGWKKHGSFAFEDLSIKNISSQKKIISVRLRGLTLNN